VFFVCLASRIYGVCLTVEASMIRSPLVVSSVCAFHRELPKFKLSGGVCFIETNSSPALVCMFNHLGVPGPLAPFKKFHEKRSLGTSAVYIVWM
jgi:hypothetical protein